MPRIKWLAKDIPAKCTALNGARTAWTFEGVDRLMLECTASGQRLWKVRYQVWMGGRRLERKYDIGRLDPEARRVLGAVEQDDVLSPGQARDKALAILARVNGGEDPWQADRSARLEPQACVRTVTSIYQEWLDDPARKRKLRPRTKEEYERIFRLHLAPHFGRLDIAALDKRKISDALEQVRLSTTDAAKGQRGLQATKALKLLNSVCQYAEDREYILRNPARGVSPPVPDHNPEGRQHRPLRESELRMIWREAPSHMNEQNVRLLRLALLLGKRVSELSGALKSELNLDHVPPRWIIPATREGNKGREDQLVPLPPLAAALLRLAVEARGPSPYVFQARTSSPKPISRHTPSQVFTEFRRAVGILDKVRFHDCRGLIVDQMAQLGVPREFRSQVLHHTGDMRATLADKAYSTYDYESEKRRALTLWQDRLLEIVEGRGASGLRW
jgi:integrase